MIDGVEDVLNAPTLTDRQQLVLELIACGRTNAAIASALYLTEDGVKTLVRRMYPLLGVRDRAHAVAMGFQLGLLGVEKPAPEPEPTAEPEPPLPLGVCPEPTDRERAVAEAAELRRAVGEELRMLRRRRRWTLAETSERAHMSEGVLSRIETGDRSLSVVKLALVCAALGVAPIEVVRLAQDRAFPEGWPHPPAKESTEDQIVALYAEGYSIQQIADHVGQGYGTVRRHLLGAGVTLRPRGGLPTPRLPFDVRLSDMIRDAEERIPLADDTSDLSEHHHGN